METISEQDESSFCNGYRHWMQGILPYKIPAKQQQNILESFVPRKRMGRDGAAAGGDGHDILETRKQKAATHRDCGQLEWSEDAGQMDSCYRKLEYTKVGLYPATA